MHGNSKSFVMENQQENCKYIPMYYFCSTTLFCGLKVNLTESSWKSLQLLETLEKQKLAVTS